MNNNAKVKKTKRKNEVGSFTVLACSLFPRKHLPPFPSLPSLPFLFLLVRSIQVVSTFKKKFYGLVGWKDAIAVV